MDPKEYRRYFVDGFVELSSSIGYKLISEEGIYSKAISYQWINDAISSMSSEQIKAIKEIIKNEREGALHDALVFLDDELCLNNTQIVHNGEPMYFTKSGLTLFQEYVGRRAGDSWDDYG